jgi:photosystem II stability/assembly factor-like uncharacterized protein
MIRHTLVLMLLAAAPAITAYRQASPRARPVPPPEPVVWTEVPRDSGGAEFTARGAVRQVLLQPDGRGIAVGHEQRIWSSADGGYSWRVDTAGPAPTLPSVAITRDAVLVVAANGRIFRSEHGAPWEPVHSAGGAAARLRAVGPDTVVLAGDRLMARSVDSGRTWTNVDVPAQTWFDVVFASPLVGYAGGGAGLVLRTGDGGETWRARDLPSREMLRGMAVLDERTVVVVGSNGAIHRTGDGGMSWQQSLSGTAMHLTSVVFADDRHGMAVGLYGTALLTRDGGVRWTPENTGTDAHLWFVTVDDRGIAHAGGWYDTIIRRNRSLADPD